MERKTYQQPLIKTDYLRLSQLCEGSNTGATGEDVPWGTKDRESNSDFYDYINENTKSLIW